jgi:hypothetical protein
MLDVPLAKVYHISLKCGLQIFDNACRIAIVSGAALNNNFSHGYMLICVAYQHLQNKIGSVSEIQ